MPVVIAVSRATDPLAPAAIVLLALLATWLLGRVPLRRLLAPMSFALVLGFGMFWMGALFYASAGLSYSPGPVGLSPVSALNGATMASRLLAIFAVSLLFVLTTDPVKLVLALIHQLRVPYKIGYAVFASYRFIPLFQEELENIRAAHLMRKGRSRGPLAALRRAAGYTVPLLAIGVRKGERVALAMDARAFGALPSRTYYRRTELSSNDAIFFAGAMLALTAAILAAHQFASLGGLP